MRRSAKGALSSATRTASACGWGESDFDHLAVVLLDQQTDFEDGGPDYT
jgi:hypothetical protein